MLRKPLSASCLHQRGRLFGFRWTCSPRLAEQTAPVNHPGYFSARSDLENWVLFSVRQQPSQLIGQDSVHSFPFLLRA